MRLFSSCREVSRFKIVIWKFKRKTCTVLSSRKSCRTLLGSDQMSAGCYLARNALCTQMKLSSLLPIAGKKILKKKKIRNSSLPHHYTLLPTHLRSEVYSCQSLEILGMQLPKVQPLLLKM